MGGGLGVVGRYVGMSGTERESWEPKKTGGGEGGGRGDNNKIPIKTRSGGGSRGE
jgi:hypothetical protein